MLVNYATWYPEAVPLWNTTASMLLRELIQIFSWAGLSSEILNGQGTNVVSITGLVHPITGVESLELGRWGKAVKPGVNGVVLLYWPESVRQTSSQGSVA